MSYCFRHVQRSIRHRIRGFVQRDVPLYSVDEFKMHFRMSRITMQAVYEEISSVLRQRHIPMLSIRMIAGGRQQV